MYYLIEILKILKITKFKITLTSSVLRTRVNLCENELFIIKQWNGNY